MAPRYNKQITSLDPYDALGIAPTASLSTNVLKRAWQRAVMHVNGVQTAGAVASSNTAPLPSLPFPNHSQVDKAYSVLQEFPGAAYSYWSKRHQSTWNPGANIGTSEAFLPLPLPPPLVDLQMAGARMTRSGKIRMPLINNQPAVSSRQARSHRAPASLSSQPACPNRPTASLAVDFLAMPAELRLKVYNHYLVRKSPYYPTLHNPTDGARLPARDNTHNSGHYPAQDQGKRDSEGNTEVIYKPNPLAFLLVSKQVFQEAIPVFYGECKFVLPQEYLALQDNVHFHHVWRNYQATPMWAPVALPAGVQNLRLTRLTIELPVNQVIWRWSADALERHMQPVLRGMSRHIEELTFLFVLSQSDVPVSELEQTPELFDLLDGLAARLRPSVRRLTVVLPQPRKGSLSLEQLQSKERATAKECKEAFDRILVPTAPMLQLAVECGSARQYRNPITAEWAEEKKEVEWDNEREADDIQEEGNEGAEHEDEEPAVEEANN